MFWQSHLRLDSSRFDSIDQIYLVYASAPLLIAQSNGTYVNKVRVPKGSTRPLAANDQVALYYPQGAAALGRPILYDVELNADAFEKVCVCVRAAVCVL